MSPHDLVALALGSLFAITSLLLAYRMFAEDAAEKEEQHRHELFIEHQKGFREGMNFAKQQARREIDQ